MKKTLSIFAIFLFAFVLISCSEETSTILITTTTTITTTSTIASTEELLSGIELFGEPGLTPEVFAPDFISTELSTEFAGTFSPDYEHFFYTMRTDGGTNRLYYTTLIDDEWTVPEMSPISENTPESEPFITNDGSTLYFQSRRDDPGQFYLYQSSFVDGIWETPVYAENGLNDDFAMYITVSDSGNIYFTGLDSSNSVGIYVINLVGGIYQSAEFTGVYGAHPYISPDESYMLLDKGLGTSDYIYISLNNNGDWTYPTKLGEDVNQPGAIQICASVTPDGRYFFFSRFIDGRGDIFWVEGEYLTEYLS
jgi:hypothetical protein